MSEWIVVSNSFNWVKLIAPFSVKSYPLSSWPSNSDRIVIHLAGDFPSDGLFCGLWSEASGFEVRKSGLSGGTS